MKSKDKQASSSSLNRLLDHLSLPPDKRELFLTTLAAEPESTQALIWVKTPPANDSAPFSFLPKPNWAPNFISLVDRNQQPGKNALHQEGHYYCLDLSSVFCASALKICPPNPNLIIDLCSSPGGKAVFAWKLLGPKFLLCNETISKRLAALISNLKRLVVNPCAVFAFDSSVLAERVGACADLVIVDAPCSGQSLLRKGIESPGCFHPSVINTNMNRQRRIMANASKMVKAGGVIAYMTCTYSRQENEKVIEWFVKKFPEFEPVAVPELAEYQSTLTDLNCYRLWPWQGGAGGFVCVLRSKKELEGEQEFELGDLNPCWQVS